MNKLDRLESRLKGLQQNDSPNVRNPPTQQQYPQQNQHQNQQEHYVSAPPPAPGLYNSDSRAGSSRRF